MPLRELKPNPRKGGRGGSTISPSSPPGVSLASQRAPISASDSADAHTALGCGELLPSATKACSLPGGKDKKMERADSVERRADIDGSSRVTDPTATTEKPGTSVADTAEGSTAAAGAGAASGKRKQARPVGGKVDAKKTGSHESGQDCVSSSSMGVLRRGPPNVREGGGTPSPSPPTTTSGRTATSDGTTAANAGSPAAGSAAAALPMGIRLPRIQYPDSLTQHFSATQPHISLSARPAALSPAADTACSSVLEQVLGDMCNGRLDRAHAVLLAALPMPMTAPSTAAAPARPLSSSERLLLALVHLMLLQVRPALGTHASSALWLRLVGYSGQADAQAALATLKVLSSCIDGALRACYQLLVGDVCKLALRDTNAAVDAYSRAKREAETLMLGVEARGEVPLSLANYRLGLDRLETATCPAIAQAATALLAQPARAALAPARHALVLSGALANALAEKRNGGPKGPNVAQAEAAPVRHLSPEGINMLRAAAQAKYAPSQYSLGSYLLHQADAQQQRDGLAWLQCAATQGFLIASHTIGNYYATLGGGIKRTAAVDGDDSDDDALEAEAADKDAESAAAAPAAPDDEALTQAVTMPAALALRTAVMHYECAAEGGYAPAQYILALCYRYGRGVPVHAGKSGLWLKRAAEQNEPRALFLIGRSLCESGTNVPLGINHLERAASEGLAVAHLALGRVVEDGLDATVSNAVDATAPPGRLVRGSQAAKAVRITRATEFYRHAAAAGLADGASEVARLTAALSTSPETTLAAFQTAAKNGSAVALFNVAVCHTFGIGTPVNFSRAMIAARRARGLGYPAAANAMGMLLIMAAQSPANIAVSRPSSTNTNGVQSDDGQPSPGQTSASVGQVRVWPPPTDNATLEAAMDLFREAAHAHVSDGLYNLAHFLLVTSKATKEGEKEALAYLGEAAQAGHPFALLQQAVFFNQGTRVPLNHRLALALETRARARGLTMASPAAQHLVDLPLSRANKIAKTAVKRGSKLTKLTTVHHAAAAAGAPETGSSLPKKSRKVATGSKVCAGGTQLQRSATKGAAGAVVTSSTSSSAKPVQIDSALAQRLQAARNGDPAAQCELGVIHLKGNGVTTNVTLAVEWFRKAAAQGFSLAQSHLGECYKQGLGVAPDDREAARWFGLAAASDNIVALCNLADYELQGRGLNRSAEQAVVHYQRAATLGSSYAQCCLAACYFAGSGVEQSYEHALRWWREAANKGQLAEAMFNLGLCYSSGYGVERSSTQAVHWFERAAKLNNAAAQCNLGSCYDQGVGVERDLRQAFYWWNAAATRGDPVAMRNLARCHVNGLGTKRDPALAVHYFRMATSHKDAEAQLHLADMYERGVGVPQDPQQAMTLYRPLAEANNPHAQMCLARVLERLAWERAPPREDSGIDVDDGSGSPRSERGGGQPARREGDHPPGTEGSGKARPFGSGADDAGDTEPTPFPPREGGRGQASLSRRGLDEALVWYRRAAQHGGPEACYQLARLLLRMNTGPVAEPALKEVSELCERAASKGYGPAQYCYALCLEHGLGVACDTAEARKWRARAEASRYVAPPKPLPRSLEALLHGAAVDMADKLASRVAAWAVQRSANSSIAALGGGKRTETASSEVIGIRSPEQPLAKRAKERSSEQQE